MGIGHYNCCGHCNTAQYWTTTIDITTINNKNAVDIASVDNIIGHCSNRQQQQKKERDLDIASLDNNTGHYNCCGHCINGQQHWTTILDITAINNKKLWTLHQWTTTFDIAAIRHK